MRAPGGGYIFNIGSHRSAIRAYINQDGALQPEDIAATVVFMAGLPPRVNISEVWIRATTDVAY